MMGRILGRGGATPPSVGRGPGGTPTAATPMANVGIQGVSAKRTASGSESAYTDTAITLPVSAKPTTCQVTVSAGNALVKVTTAGNRVSSGSASYGQPFTQDLSGLPPTDSVTVSTEAGAAADIAITVGYADK